MPSFEIIPTVGWGEITLGMKLDKLMQILGLPDNTECINDSPFPETKILSYYEKGVYLFFNTNDQQLNLIEIDSPETLLWGENIFSLNEKSIIELFKKNGFLNPEIELHEMGEKRYSYDAIGLDLFFENNVLVAVSIAEPIISEQNFTFSLN